MTGDCLTMVTGYSPLQYWHFYKTTSRFISIRYLGQHETWCDYLDSSGLKQSNRRFYKLYRWNTNFRFPVFIKDAHTSTRTHNHSLCARTHTHTHAHTHTYQPGYNQCIPMHITLHDTIYEHHYLNASICKDWLKAATVCRRKAGKLYCGSISKNTKSNEDSTVLFVIKPVFISKCTCLVWLIFTEYFSKI